MFKIRDRRLSGREISVPQLFATHIQGNERLTSKPAINRRLYFRQNTLLLSILSCLVTVVMCGCGGLVWNTGITGEVTPTPGKISFGAVPIGKQVTSKLSLGNQGLAPVTISKLSVTGSSFHLDGSTILPATLTPGGSLSIDVRFIPTTKGATTGKLTVNSDSATSPMAVVGLAGIGSVTTDAPTLSAVSCGTPSLNSSDTKACSVYLSAPATSPFVVNLSSDNQLVSVPSTVSVLVGATSTGFNAVTSTVNSTQSVTLTASAGGVSQTDVMQLNPVAPSSPSGSASLGLSATSLSFGDVTVGTLSTNILTLKSSGTLPVTISSATLTGTAFSVLGTNLPVTLNAGQSVSLTVQFNPTVTGPATSQLTIISDSLTNNPALVSLSGNGVTAPTAPTALTHVVQLNWTAPISSTDPIDGYRVYRSLSGASSYNLLNSSIDVQTTYADATVQSGTSYDYIVKSVDYSNVESSPSEIVTVTIP